MVNNIILEKLAFDKNRYLQSTKSKNRFLYVNIYVHMYDNYWHIKNSCNSKKTQQSMVLYQNVYNYINVTIRVKIIQG